MQRSQLRQPQAGPSRAGSVSQQPLNKPPEKAKQDDRNKDPKKATDKKTIEFSLPALSIVGKKKELDFELIRKKIMRRGNPEGEDKKQLAAILKHLKESKTKIRVQEFVNLVAKFTADNGEIMRKVMEDDLISFRKLVTKVYETMTQDVSDVLVNEQIQATNFYQERNNMFNSKMMWMISEIFQMIPEFDFEKFEKDKTEFLNYICPIPALIERNAEDVELQRRQEAFHRLQWLRIEEERLAEENRRLDARLDYLKNQLDRDNTHASMKSKLIEQRMHDLEDEEQEKQEKLNELEGVLGKNIVRTEAYIRLEEDEAIRMTKPSVKEDTKKTTTRHKESDGWSSRTAAGIEEQAAKRLVDAGRAVTDEKRRMRRREREPDRETTLFGETRDKDYPEMRTMRRLDEKTVQQTTTTIHERRPPRPRKKGACGGGCG
ncbi:uncharacterized protein LOC109537860 [Dendroctonus ponderosae]|uniref:MIF4G domain-containing protein n=1 Tax=Dendroctonus ponderosae TaxID=77166 RepID=A0AAR5PHW6_DENPD|nr:uncharacterized protein LOC109537860 [Dendroctonus ponderosae]XP_019760347.1 uncharacterized protein LOC109537860 [Dendroctonus ponderosae]KAH1016033.1 hypothetical protein HUJ04_007318 [Dendroctonus ponderosae]